MNPEELSNLTFSYGAAWGLKHSERLLTLTALLGEGMEYDREVIKVAAYLHDWGAYPQWAVSGVEHHIRSRQVAESFLAEHGYPPDRTARVLECIEFHHGGPPNRSVESRLFTDADALDLIGVVGTLRIFSMWPRDLRAACDAVRRWRETCINALSFDAAKKIARERIEETDGLMKRFEEETFGCF